MGLFNNLYGRFIVILTFCVCNSRRESIRYKFTSDVNGRNKNVHVSVYGEKENGAGDDDGKREILVEARASEI